jgi:hypothetical protein
MPSTIACQVQVLGCGQSLATTHVVIQKQSKAQQPSGPQTFAVRQHKTKRPNNVRRKRPQNLTLDQGFAHQTEFVVLKVAQPTVNEFRRPGGRPACEIIHLTQVD